MQRRFQSSNLFIWSLIFISCIGSRLLSTIYYIEDLDSLRFALSMVDYDVAKLQPHFPAIPCFLLDRQTSLRDYAPLCVSIFTHWRVINLLHNLLYTKDCEDLGLYTVGKNCHLCDIYESLALADEQSLYARCDGRYMSVRKPLFYNNTSGKQNRYTVGLLWHHRVFPRWCSDGYPTLVPSTIGALHCCYG